MDSPKYVSLSTTSSIPPTGAQWHPSTTEVNQLAKQPLRLQSLCYPYQLLKAPFKPVHCKNVSGFPCVRGEFDLVQA